MAARPEERLTKPDDHAGGARDQRLARTLYRVRGETRSELDPAALMEALRSPEGVLWVDIDAAERHQHALLEKIFHFHPLAIEDTLNPDSRVKLEEYDGYLFAIIRGVEFDESTEDPYDLDTLNLCFFLGPNYLVTVHSRPSQACAELDDRVARSPDVLDRGAARLMHSLMDAAIDDFFPVIERVDEFIATLEERILVTQSEQELRTVFAVKRLVLSLRRHLAPQREVFGLLANRPNPLLPIEVQLYFRDIYDHVLRLNDSFEVQRDMLTSTMEAYLSQVSNRLGQVTKGLAVIATLSIPFVVVSGMWGMNFDRIPLSGWHNGFWLMLVVQLGLGYLLIVLLQVAKMAVTGLALFGVAPLSSRNGRGLAPGTRIIAAKDVGAIVRAVPYEPLEPTDENIEAYERVIDTVFERQTVVPAPFGSIFRNQDHVIRWLQMHYITLTEAIHVVEGRCEGRLHVRSESDALVDEPDPVLVEQANEIYRAVSHESDAAVMLKRPSMHALASGAFLVDRSEWSDFSELVLGHGRRADGLVVELTGPWAPYDFVRMDLGA